MQTCLKGIVRGGAYVVVVKRVQGYRENHGYHFATPCLLSAAFAMQPGSGVPAEFTIYSGRIGGLTAAKLLGASPERINVWGGWVQGGTSWAPNLCPDIHFDVPCDVAFGKTCFGHLLPIV